MNRLSATLSQAWLTIQGSLFPWLAEELGPLTEKQQDLVATLELVRIEAPIPSVRGFPGRPADDRSAIARALVAKAVYHLPTTRVLLDRLAADIALRKDVRVGAQKRRARRMDVFAGVCRVLDVTVAGACARGADCEKLPKRTGGPRVEGLDRH